MDLTIFLEKYRSGRRWFSARVYRPLLTWTAAYLCQKANMPMAEPPPRPAKARRPEWKEQAVADFDEWLADLPDELKVSDDVGTESCDLYTLMLEFINLRQEIRLQNREQRNATKTQQSFIDGHIEIANLFERKTRELEKLEENIRMTSEKKAVAPFLDVRDALIRGLASARQVSRARGIFRRAPKGIEGIVDGYEMCLRRFDRALSFLDIHPVDAVGQPFDSATMQALDRRNEDGYAPGVVLEQILSGFIRGNEVLRSAQVVVNAPEEN